VVSSSFTTRTFVRLLHSFRSIALAASIGTAPEARKTTSSISPVPDRPPLYKHTPYIFKRRPSRRQSNNRRCWQRLLHVRVFVLLVKFLPGQGKRQQNYSTWTPICPCKAINLYSVASLTLDEYSDPNLRVTGVFLDQYPSKSKTNQHQSLPQMGFTSAMSSVSCLLCRSRSQGC
jgi:hypothetical protein